MTRTLTITAAEVPVILAAIQSGEHVWLVREGTWTFPYGVEFSEPVPPVEFTLACAPCEGCNGSRCDLDMCEDCGNEYEEPCVRHREHGSALCDGQCCPDCRIELVGPCPNVDSWGDPCEGAYEIAQGEWRPCPLCDGENAKPGTVTLGHAYAVGEPKQTEDGKWELLLQVVPG